MSPATSPYSPVLAADWQPYALRQMLTRHGKPSAVSLFVPILCMERDCGDAAIACSSSLPRTVLR